DASAGFLSRFQLMHATCHGYYVERPEVGVNASIRQRYAEARGARELTTPGTRDFPIRHSRGTAPRCRSAARSSAEAPRRTSAELKARCAPGISRSTMGHRSRAASLRRT